MPHFACLIRPLVALLLVSVVARAQEPVRAVVLAHANVIDGASDTPQRDVTVVLAGGRIERIVKGDAGAIAGAIAGALVIDLRGRWVLPGLIDAHTHISSLAGGVTSLDALRLVVTVNADHGVDVIKTRGTERAGLPNTDPRKQSYTEEQLRTIVEAAASRGLPVLAHAHGDEGAYAAVKAGVKSIEHGTYLSDSTLRLMAQRGTFLVPTYSTLLDLRDPGGDYDDPVLHLRAEHMIPVAQQMVRRARQLGVRVITGADTQYGPLSITRISQEIVNFTLLGFTPMDAIRAGTSLAADALGIGAKTGRVGAGLEADLIVVEGNPLDDIRTIQDVTIVISNGRVALNRLPFGK